MCIFTFYCGKYCNVQIAGSVSQQIRGLLQLSDEDLAEVDQHFQITVPTLQTEVDTAGPVIQKLVELKPGGANIKVNSSNCREFVDLYCKYILETGVETQLKPFREGFLNVVGGRVVSLCSADELSLMTNGHAFMDGQGLEDLEAVTKYVVQLRATC